jgi:hypothetical protein
MISIVNCKLKIEAIVTSKNRTTAGLTPVLGCGSFLVNVGRVSDKRYMGAWIANFND